MYINLIFECLGKIFCVEFQSYPSNSTENVSPIPAFAKLYLATSANNSILAGVQYIFIHKILPQHQQLSN